MWVLGITVFGQGAFGVETLVRPASVASLRALAPASLGDVEQRALADALLANARVMLPLGVAQVALGGLMIVAAVRAAFVRRSASGFALQVVLANVLLAAAELLVGGPVRQAVTEAVLTSGLDPQIEAALVRHAWLLQARYLIGPVTLLFCAFALARWRRREREAAAALAAAAHEYGRE